MRFNVLVIDPPGYRFGHFLFDAVRMIAGSLEALGHDVTITRNAIEKGRVNVLVGVHLLADRTLGDELAAARAPYVVVQTEMIHGRTINREDTGDRLETILLPLFRGALAVWDSSTANLAALAALGVDAKMLRFGHVPSVREIRPKASRDIDFFWYGSVTAHRRDVLNKLASLGYRVEATFDAAQLFRNDLIARSEIVLTLRQSDAMPHVPHGRILYLVANHCLVAGEGGLEQEPVEDLFVWGDPNDTIELLRETRARADRRELAEGFHATLAKRPMSAFVAPLVEALGSAL